MPDIQIHPSILAADKTDLRGECLRMDQAGADGLHLDIMDGRFVNNISLGFPFIEAIHQATALPLSVHLMILRPDEYVQQCVEGGSHTVFIHAEAPCPVSDTLKRLRDGGVGAGLTLNPESPFEMAEPYLDDTDAILCMSVHPGFGGQSFIAGILDKVRRLRLARPDLDLCIDGGISRETAVQAAAYGINQFFVGTTLFKAPDPQQAMSDWKEAIRAAYGSACKSVSP